MDLAEILEDEKQLESYRMNRDFAEWGHRLAKIKVVTYILNFLHM